MDIRILGEEDEPHEDLERKSARDLSAVVRGHNLSDEDAARVLRKFRPVITEVLVALDGRERQLSALRRKDARPVEVSLEALRHQAVGKEEGETSHVERWINTLRQRLSRFVRKTLSFSKSRHMHHCCLKLFVYRYNLERKSAILG